MSLIKNLTKAALTANVGVEDLEEEVLPVEGELEQQILEVVEAQIEAEQHEEAVQQLETASVALEAFALQLESMQDKGVPLSRAGATFMQAGVEHLVNSIGYEGHKAVGLESFDGETDAIDATNVSLEGLKETLAAVWKGIKEAVARAVNAVLAFVGKLFSSVESLDVRARKLAIDAGKTKGTVKAGSKLSLPAAVSFKGEASVSAVKSGLSDTASTITTLYANAAGEAKSYYDALAKAAADVADKKEVDSEAVEKAGAPTASFSEDLLGGKKVVSAKSGVGYTVEGGEGKGGEVDVPSLADIKAIAAGVRAVVSAVKAKKAAFAAINAEQKAAMAAADKLIADADKGAFGKVVDSAKARWVLKATQVSFTNSLSKVTGVAVRGAYAAVQVGEAAVKKYGKTDVAVAK